MAYNAAMARCALDVSLVRLTFYPIRRCACEARDMAMTVSSNPTRPLGGAGALTCAAQRRQWSALIQPIVFPAARMSLPPSQHRKPYEPVSYAALKTSDAPVEPVAKAQPLALRDSADSESAIYFAAEAGKLAQLRAALWSAFEAAPAACIPPALIDLTVAYTTALQLELNLMGGARPARAGSQRLRPLAGAGRDSRE